MNSKKRKSKMIKGKQMLKYMEDIRMKDVQSLEQKSNTHPVNTLDQNLPHEQNDTGQIRVRRRLVLGKKDKLLGKSDTKIGKKGRTKGTGVKSGDNYGSRSILANFIANDTEVIKEETADAHHQLNSVAATTSSPEEVERDKPGLPETKLINESWT